MKKNKWLRGVPGVLVFWAAISLAEQQKTPMPPTFSYANDPVEVLRSYPLGVINTQDAFAHHGGAVRKVTLPNGNQGWLYKSGEKIGVPSLYILQFSNEGIVIDVLHKDYRYKIGHTALQYQYLHDVVAEIQTLGPGPGQ